MKANEQKQGGQRRETVSLQWLALQAAEMKMKIFPMRSTFTLISHIGQLVAGTMANRGVNREHKQEGKHYKARLRHSN